MKPTSSTAGRFKSHRLFIVVNCIALVVFIALITCRQTQIDGRVGSQLKPNSGTQKPTATATTSTSLHDYDHHQQQQQQVDKFSPLPALISSNRKLSTRSLDDVPLKQSPHKLGLRTRQATNSQQQPPPAPQQVVDLRRHNSSCPSSAQSLAEQSVDELAGAGQLEQPTSSFGFVQSRVSEFVKPNFYTLRLKVDPNKRKFSGQLMISVDLQRTNVSTASVRHLTLHAGSNLSIKKAFYVFTQRASIQIPATKVSRDFERELLTLDFHPNSIQIPSQGLLLLVYSGLVNETDSHGLFLHRRNIEPYAQHQQSDSQQPTAGLATHMEPSFARRLFPAWDEPHLKARFSLIVVLPFRGYETISNMPAKRKSISLSCSGEPLQEIEFQTTPTMSTYLLTLVVGHFEHIESITPNNCRIRVYFYANQTGQLQQQQVVYASVLQLPPAQSGGASNQNQTNQRRHQAQMALDFAVRVFDYLESALGVKYPLAKFDMIALRDFHSGGMENWGAALFHENYLLYDNSSSNVNIRVNGAANRAKRLVVPLVVAHEIVHQWFGNLLTSRSWTYLWLNEGFAQLLMYEVAQALYPQEAYWNIFLEDNRRSAMLEDELITTARALELEETQLQSQEDQLSLFDQLTYNKGAMLLRMVQFAFGPREFMSGLKHYLLKHAYESVVSHDLWQALEESSSGRRLQDKQLEQLMGSWLTREGFPLISARLSSNSTVADHYKLELRQERFTLLPAEASSWPPTTTTTVAALFNESAAGSEQDNSNQQWASYIWSVPVTFVSELWPQPSELQLRLWPPPSSAPQAPTSLLVSEKWQVVMLPKSWMGAWLKLNHNAIGYFRVNYETPPDAAAPQSLDQPIDLLGLMKPAIRDAELNAMNRFNVVEDLFAMVLSGRKPLVYYLRFLQEAYSQEGDQLVLRFIFESLERIKLAIVSNSLKRTSSVGSRGPTRATAAAAAAANFNNESAMKMSDQELERAFDRWVRMFVRKVIGAQVKERHQTIAPMTHQRHRRRLANGNGDQFGSFVSLNNWQQRKSGNNNNSTSFELLELLDSVHLTYSRGVNAAHTNELDQNQTNQGDNKQAADQLLDEQPHWALQLFARHFRHSAPIVTGAGSQRGPLDAVGRELRASIYSAALNHKQQTAGEEAPAAEDETELALAANERRLKAYVTSSTLQLSSMRQQLRAAAAATPPVSTTTTTAPNASSLSTAPLVSSLATGNFSHEDVVFGRLLRAYELSCHESLASSAVERAALAQALGSTQNLTKQVFLLNLTLSNQTSFFRQYDASLLLESLGQTQLGRQLIWLQLNEQSNLFKQRQLLAVALKSVARGLIETIDQQQDNNNNQAIERQLRQLYATYGNGEHGGLIGQSIEWVRINTLWFKRDHDQLVDFLSSSGQQSQLSPTTATTTTTTTDIN